MACLLASIRSQLSRIKQRPPATDLSGPKAFVESLTVQRSNLAAVETVDFRFDSSPSTAALGSAPSPGGRPLVRDQGGWWLLQISLRVGSKGVFQFVGLTPLPHQRPPRVCPVRFVFVPLEFFLEIFFSISKTTVERCEMYEM